MYLAELLLKKAAWAGAHDKYTEFLVICERAGEARGTFVARPETKPLAKVRKLSSLDWI